MYEECIIHNVIKEIVQRLCKQWQQVFNTLQLLHMQTLVKQKN